MKVRHSRPMSWMADLARTALLVPVLAGPACAQTAPAPPSCSGQDLLELARDKQPDAWNRVNAVAAKTLNGRGIFWRIEVPGKPDSHLLGTVHLTDVRVNDLPPAIMAALDASKSIALEVADLSTESLSAAIAKVQHLLAFTDGRSLGQLLPADEQSIARKALEKAGMPGAALEALKPWVVTMTLALTECERLRTMHGLQPLDVRIGARGRERGIPVVGLETLEDQLRALAAVPDDDQLTVLRASLTLYDQSDDMLETIVRRYLDRNIGTVWPLQEELWSSAGFQATAFESFRRELVTKRNLRMRDAALPLFKEGGAFIAVGALHLPGKDGLVELLRAAGLKVVPGE